MPHPCMRREPALRPSDGAYERIGFTAFPTLINVAEPYNDPLMKEGRKKVGEFKSKRTTINDN